MLAIVNSRDFDDGGHVQYLNNFLTVKCNGCHTVSFCHVTRCSKEEEYESEGRPFLVAHKKMYPKVSLVGKFPSENFVDAERILALRRIVANKFDCARLVTMLDELNAAYRTGCYISCVVLVRALLNHIPPIFECKSFAEVANNYVGSGKSFRESMLHLEQASRKIADSHLHLQIRAKESLPTKMQVEFRADVDVLLAEIIWTLELSAKEGGSVVGQISAA